MRKSIQKMALILLVVLCGCATVIGTTTTAQAATKTTTTVKNRTTSKKVRMSKASKKTYSSKKKPTTKTSSKTSSKVSNDTKTVTTVKTTVKTQVTNKFKKNSKVKTVVTKKTTTVKTTVNTSELEATASAAAGTNGVKVETEEATRSVDSYMAQVDSRLSSAFKQLGFKVVVDSSAKQSGLFSSSKQQITLFESNDVLWHEMGHFLSFMASGADSTDEFMAIYAAEKSLYNDYNVSYITSSSAEYFAESFKNYTADPAALQASRPRTYNYIVESLNKVTPERISYLRNVCVNVLGMWTI